MPDKTITQDKFNGTYDVTFTLDLRRNQKVACTFKPQRKSLLERFVEMIGVRKSPRLADESNQLEEIQQRSRTKKRNLNSLAK